MSKKVKRKEKIDRFKPKTKEMKNHMKMKEGK